VCVSKVCVFVCVCVCVCACVCLHCPLVRPQLVKLCSGMIEAGRAYVSANKLFVNGIKDLATQVRKEEMVSVSTGLLLLLLLLLGSSSTSS